MNGQITQWCFPGWWYKPIWWELLIKTTCQRKFTGQIFCKIPLRVKDFPKKSRNPRTFQDFRGHFIFRDFLAPMQPPSRSLLTFIFDELKKIVLKWKIVQNYKTGGNYSKFIDIYNIVIDLDTRDDILSVMNPKRFSHT